MKRLGLVAGGALLGLGLGVGLAAQNSFAIDGLSAMTGTVGSAVHITWTSTSCSAPNEIYVYVAPPGSGYSLVAEGGPTMLSADYTPAVVGDHRVKVSCELDPGAGLTRTEINSQSAHLIVSAPVVTTTSSTTTSTTTTVAATTSTAPVTTVAVPATTAAAATTTTAAATTTTAAPTTTTTRATATTAAAATTTTTLVSASALPKTGVNNGILAVLGSLCGGAGGLLLYYVRRRSLA